MKRYDPRESWTWCLEQSADGVLVEYVDALAFARRAVEIAWREAQKELMYETMSIEEILAQAERETK